MPERSLGAASSSSRQMVMRCAAPRDWMRFTATLPALTMANISESYTLVESVESPRGSFHYSSSIGSKTKKRYSVSSPDPVSSF